jgi:hypothetical protein
LAIVAIVAASWLATGDGVIAFDGNSITDYGKECKAELGPLPLTWDCVKQGTEIPIDTDEKVDRAPCATPPWLKLGNEGHCVKGARLLKLDTGKANTEVRVICRRYTRRKDFKDNKGFEDIAVIGHNSDTGKTCFFQARSAENDVLDGSNVPSPMADPGSLDPKEAKAGKDAKTFWLAPAQLNQKALRCSLCHDNDAWMRTPYIDQITDKVKDEDEDKDKAKRENEVPSKKADSWKDDAIDEPNKYSLVQQQFLIDHAWPQPLSILTAKVRDGHDKVKPQICTQCHRIANQETKNRWLDWATAFPTNIIDEKGDLTWDHYRWMPQEGAEDDSDWQKSYNNHVKAMICCLKNPEFSGCAKLPIFDIKKGDKPVWGDAKKGTCIDDTGNVSYSVKLDENVAAARGEDENSCEGALDNPAVISFSIVHSQIDGQKVMPRAGAGKSFGVQVPVDDPGLVSSAQLFPGDVLEAKLLNTMAWDQDHHLLKFDRWTDEAGSSQGCPCEDPTNPTCKFTTRGASDWFGQNPLQPTFPGDPPEFQCVTHFNRAGGCLPEGGRKIYGMVNCDCEHVSFGVVTGSYIKQCKATEAGLHERLIDGSFHVEADSNNKITSGDVCDSEAHGSSAWPLAGGPIEPPPVTDGPRCRYVGGLIQYACD